MRLLWQALSGALLGIAALATLFFAFGLADLWALLFGGVSPGDRMFGDRSAPTLLQALLIVVAEAAVLVVAVALHRSARARSRRATQAPAARFPES